MKIKRLEPIAVSLPMKKPVKMAGETVRSADNLFVRLEGEGGIVGWGEAASAPTMTGETIESMLAAARLLTPCVEGQAADIAEITRAMDARLYGNHGAKAAIEMALHDLIGRATGRPVHALLGERKRSRMPALWTLAGGDEAGDLRQAEQRRAGGYTAYKIKVGVNAPEIDAARTRRICDALGSGLLISADANQGWTADQAIAYVRAVADTTLDFFEQPVAADDLEGMARVAAASRVAIGADEGIHLLADIRHHHAAGVKGVSLKAIKLGGLRAVVEAGTVCASLGMHVNVACKAGESSLASAAALHVAAVLPAIDWGLSVTSIGLADDVTARPIAFDHGYVTLPEGPGLGIDVDEARLRRYQINASAEPPRLRAAR